METFIQNLCHSLCLCGSWEVPFCTIPWLCHASTMRDAGCGISATHIPQTLLQYMQSHYTVCHCVPCGISYAHAQSHIWIANVCNVTGIMKLKVQKLATVFLFPVNHTINHSAFLSMFLLILTVEPAKPRATTDKTFTVNNVLMAMDRLCSMMVLHVPIALNIETCGFWICYFSWQVWP